MQRSDTVWCSLNLMVVMTMWSCRYDFDDDVHDDDDDDHNDHDDHDSCGMW